MKRLISVLFISFNVLGCSQEPNITNYNIENYYENQGTPESSWIFTEIPIEVQNILNTIQPKIISSPNGVRN